eukprot:6445100-Prorocentrum_lima.AAC.1
MPLAPPRRKGKSLDLLRPTPLAPPRRKFSLHDPLRPTPLAPLRGVRHPCPRLLFPNGPEDDKERPP